MGIQVGSPAPDFAGEAVVGTEFTNVKLGDYKGKWVVLFFYPLDFTFVCPTESVALRGLFLIDPDGVLQHQTVNALNVGRSVKETLRVVKAFQFSKQHGEVCPANWDEGSEAIKPTAESTGAYLAKSHK